MKRRTVLQFAAAAFAAPTWAVAQAQKIYRDAAVYPNAAFVRAGGLISYGYNFVETFRREIAPMVDRILKGANPAEIPVQQSTRFEMVVNMIAGREIGLTIPQTVLVRADRVIE